MPVMQIRVMWMVVNERIVTMQVDVRFGTVPWEIVFMEVMPLMHV